jgi:hypothetical protein
VSFGAGFAKQLGAYPSSGLANSLHVYDPMAHVFYVMQPSANGGGALAVQHHVPIYHDRMSCDPTLCRLPIRGEWCQCAIGAVDSFVSSQHPADVCRPRRDRCLLWTCLHCRHGTARVRLLLAFPRSTLELSCLLVMRPQRFTQLYEVDLGTGAMNAIGSAFPTAGWTQGGYQAVISASDRCNTLFTHMDNVISNPLSSYSVFIGVDMTSGELLFSHQPSGPSVGSTVAYSGRISLPL